MRNRFFRCQIPLMFSCGFIPIPVLLCCFLNRPSLLPWLVSPAAYLLFACLCMLVPGKWRVATAVPCLAALAWGTFQVLQTETPGVRIIISFVYVFLFLFTLPIAGWERGHEPPPVFPAVSICVHLLAQFLLFVTPPAIALVNPLLGVCFVIFLLLYMLSLNRQSMASAMPEAHDVPISIRRRNRLLTWIMLGVVLLVSTIPVLGQLVQAALEWLKKLIFFIIDLLLKIFASEESSGSAGGSTEEMLSGLPTEEASLFARILEQIFVVISVVLLVVAALLALRFLWRKLKQLLRYLYGQLRHYASTASEDYVDEVEDTREQGEKHYSLAQRIMRRRNAQKNLKTLPPREQIRMRYSILRGKHPEWEQSSTARENLSESSAQLYEKARYSSHEITLQDSESFADQQGK